MREFRFTRLVFLILPTLYFSFVLESAHAQHKHMQKKEAEGVRQQSTESTIELLGIRPGISLDSVERVLQNSGVEMRAVTQDTLTNCYADRSIRIYVVDSIICRLTWMRMSLLFDASSRRLRRFSLTPRVSSIEAGQTDDINTVLLLYFGERWGKPEILFEPPACFKWRSGNTEVRGFIKRGNPLWVLEG